MLQIGDFSATLRNYTWRITSITSKGITASQIFSGIVLQELIIPVPTRFPAVLLFSTLVTKTQNPNDSPGLRNYPEQIPSLLGRKQAIFNLTLPKPRSALFSGNQFQSVSRLLSPVGLVENKFLHIQLKQGWQHKKSTNRAG